MGRGSFVLQKLVSSHGIRPWCTDKTRSQQLEYCLHNATEGWDLGHYLNFAEIRIRRSAETVAIATYHHGGGFGLTNGTKTKLTPVVEGF
jgi:hypothetical protein